MNLKKLFFTLLFMVVALVFDSPLLFAFQQASIQSVSSVSLDGPAHHGLQVSVKKIWDPNLTNFEVQLKPDTGAIYPPWSVYNNKVKPFDGETIIIPYRNGVMALQPDKKYCVRVRAVYSSEVTPWVESCGIIMSAGVAGSGDSDGDGISDADEYALGTDPNNADSDLDGIADGSEIQNQTDPNKALYADVLNQTPFIDFGTGDHFGTYPNQHQQILIVNKGDQAAKIESITISSDAFKIDTSFLPFILTHVPPQNELRLPVSFLPSLRGMQQADVEIKIADVSEPVTAKLSGVGDKIPDCDIASSETMDFGTLGVNDTSLAVERIGISNASQSGAANDAEPMTFTVLTDNLGIVPGLRGMSVPPGKAIDLPVLIPHLSAGDYSGELKIVTAACGVRTIHVNAKAE